MLFATSAGSAQTSPRFVEVSEELGVAFRHRHFGTGEKFMIENMAPGIVLFDSDGDDRLDIYVVQSAPLPGAPPDPTATNRLFRQQEDGRFADVTEEAGVGDRGYGMGASFGDVDRDGDLDLYVTNFGPNVLYLNRGDGTFEDATAAAGVGDPSWGISSGFFDPDRDGDLDLFVVNYVDFDWDNHKWCGNAQTRVRSYCHPDVYDGLPDVFYRNQGDGSFVDESVEAGIVRSADDKGLGLGFSDLDGNGTIDVYVANDSTMNYLYLGDGKGRFEESGLISGLGFNGSGGAEASMGVLIADVDGDGLVDVFVTHLDEETNTLYRNLGGGLFADQTEAAGLAAPSRPWVGFGTALFDPDADGDLDLFVANGHIIDNIELFDRGRSHRQPAQLFENLGDGRFREISEQLGVEERLVGRGVAAGDLDRDGDSDLVVAQNDGRLLVLRDDGPSGRRIAVRLIGRQSNTPGFGARLELRLGGEGEENPRLLVRELQSTSSYMSQSAPMVDFGLGEHETAAELVVRWPSGTVDRHVGLEAGRLYVLTEGIAGSRVVPFVR